MSRSAPPMRRPTSFYMPARAAAHEMWCTIAATITKSTLAMRWPTRFCSPAWVAAHRIVCCKYYCYNDNVDVRPAQEASNGRSQAKTRAAPNITCAKKPQKNGLLLLRCKKQQQAWKKNGFDTRDMHVLLKRHANMSKTEDGLQVRCISAYHMHNRCCCQSRIYPGRDAQGEPNNNLPS